MIAFSESTQDKKFSRIVPTTNIDLYASFKNKHFIAQKFSVSMVRPNLVATFPVSLQTSHARMT